METKKGKAIGGRERAEAVIRRERQSEKRSESGTANPRRMAQGVR